MFLLSQLHGQYWSQAERKCLQWRKARLGRFPCILTCSFFCKKLDCPHFKCEWIRTTKNKSSCCCPISFNPLHLILYAWMFLFFLGKTFQHAALRTDIHTVWTSAFQDKHYHLILLNLRAGRYGREEAVWKNMASLPKDKWYMLASFSGLLCCAVILLHPVVAEGLSTAHPTSSPPRSTPRSIALQMDLNIFQQPQRVLTS